MSYDYTHTHTHTTHTHEYGPQYMYTDHLSHPPYQVTMSSLRTTLSLRSYPLRGLRSTVTDTVLWDWPSTWRMPGITTLLTSGTFSSFFPLPMPQSYHRIRVTIAYFRYLFLLPPASFTIELPLLTSGSYSFFFRLSTSFTIELPLLALLLPASFTIELPLLASCYH